MFLVAITRHKIAHNLQFADVQEFKVNSFIVTIITDDYLSKFVPEPNGFSVIESPLASYPNFRDIVFSEVNYSKNSNILSIFKATISGRPIYYHVNSKGDLFCSTHISMLRKAGVTIQENTQALPQFFVYRYVMPPQTLYKNIKQILAGSRLRVRLVNGKCEIAQVDRYNPPDPCKHNRGNNKVDDISGHTLAFLRESIEALKACRDRLGILLSGGLDSSILFKICQDSYGIETTYSTGYPFEDPESNREKEYALSAAHAFGTNHVYYEVTTREYLHGFLEAISIAEEPLHHLQSVILHLLLKGGLPREKSIVVSGSGAGGIFGLAFHNHLFRSEKRIIRLLSKYPFLKSLEFACHVTGRGQSLIDALNHSNSGVLPISDANNPIWSLGAYGSMDWVSQRFDVTQQDIIEGQYNAIRPFEDRSVYDIVSILDFLGDVSVTQAIWAKLGESQRRIMYYPFNNVDMLNYVFSIPWDVKLEDFAETPKNALRRVARQLKIPEFIITRPKSAFGIRSKLWAGKGRVFEPLVPLAAKVFGENQIRDVQCTDPKKAMIFWNVLNYSIWKRLWIDNEPLGVLLEELDESFGASPDTDREGMDNQGDLRRQLYQC